jgi:hypothetical protein
MMAIVQPVTASEIEVEPPCGVKVVETEVMSVAEAASVAISEPPVARSAAAPIEMSFLNVFELVI